MCEVLGASRNGYYNYKKSTARNVDPKRERLRELVVTISKANGATYGSRRIKHALRARGYPVSRQKASSLMKEAGVTVRSKKKFKATTDSSHKLPLFDNVLNRAFAVADPDTAYVGDITYIWTQQGWLYLAVVIDLCA